MKAYTKIPVSLKANNIMNHYKTLFRILTATLVKDDYYSLFFTNKENEALRE